MDSNLTKNLNRFDEFVQDSMEKWNIPGIAIGIVKDGEVVFEKGYGYRDFEKKLEVDSDTVIPIGSSSKAFTAAALAILVDEGKIEWDKPVRDYIPFFKMKDPDLTSKVTVRDILCHRTGLPRHDLMWFNSPATRKQIVERVKHLDISADFRTTWQYSNQMYVTAGYIVEAVTGLTWEEFVKDRIFDKIDMNNTNFSVHETQEQENYAKPYVLKDKKVKEIPFMNIDQVGPAGSINSTITDMVKWLKLQLNQGRYNDNELISQGNFAQMHTPYIPAPLMPWRFKELQFSSYGFGWFIEMYRGHRMINHGGNTAGFTCLVSLIPEENLGVVIMANLHGTMMPYTVNYNILDRLLGLEEIDWNERIFDQVNKMEGAMKTHMDQMKKSNKKDTKPTHELEEYTGKFENPAYGVIAIEKCEEGLKAIYNSMEMPIRHYHYNKFLITFEFYEVHFIATFTIDNQGNIDSISIPFEQAPNTNEIVFKRVKE